MSRDRRSLFVFSAALLIGACAAEEPQGGTEDLTRQLLEQPAGDGRSTPLAVDESLVDEGSRVSVTQIGINRGEPTAPVKVVEMSDYGCGYCRQFHLETFPTLLTDFVQSGMVEWKFVPFITGMFDNSVAATEAAECTYSQSTEAFETLNSRLWEEQQAWKGSENPEGVVRGWVDELDDVDMGAFDACVEGDERIDRVASATTLARQLGVRGTPTFVVIGYPPLQGALPLEVFQEVLTAVYNESVRQRDPTGGGETPGDTSGGTTSGATGGGGADGPGGDGADDRGGQ